MNITSTRNVFVTGGGGQGVGGGVCDALAAAGWHVVVADLDAGAAESAATRLREAGHRATAVQIDVSDPGSIASALAHTSQDVGPMDALVNSAGVGLIKPVGDVTPEEWDRLHHVDLRGAFLVTRALLPGMVERGHGAIVNIGSVHSRGAMEGFGTYAAAKAGLTAFTRAVAADYGKSRIRCCIVHPGLVDSPQNRELFAQWGDPQGWIDNFVSARQAIPDLVAPHDIGAAVAFLLSDGAAMITGAELYVDGGSSALAFDRDVVR
ncbi:MAG: SDR family NAD(P)-dependent oxidoreductase [Acetobacteraceae bacterium]